MIPFARIHNVALQQSVLHRLFGVAEVRLESAGGRKPEAEMRVLKMEDALALEALVRRRGGTDMSGASTPETVAADTLLTLSPVEVLKVGLISNRGLILIGAAVAGGSQFSPRLIPNLFESVVERLFGYAGEHGFGPAEYAIAAMSLVMLCVVLLRLLSMLLALLQYFGFRLTEHERRLTVERGLLGRWRTSASRRRIQAWTLREGVMHRVLRRRTLEVDTAVAEDQNQQRALREIAPVATPAQCDALVGHLLPKAMWPHVEWRSLPMSGWWRMVLPEVLPALLATAVLGWHLGAWGLLASAMAAVVGLPRLSADAPRRVCGQRRHRRGARGLVESPLAVRRNRQAAGAASVALPDRPSLRHCHAVAGHLGRGRFGAAAARALPARGGGTGAVCGVGEDVGEAPVAVVSADICPIV